MVRLLLFVSLLAGCPAPLRYVVVDVTAHGAPVPGALVAVSCADPRYGTALRTDDDGRAAVMVGEGSSCRAFVAKPGYPTVETGLASACWTATVCAPTRVELVWQAALPRPVVEVAR